MQSTLTDFTAVPDGILDGWMYILPPDKFVVLMAIYRATFTKGFAKSGDIEKATKISRRTSKWAIQKLLKYKLIVQLEIDEPDPECYVKLYKINPKMDLNPDILKYRNL